MPNNPSSNDIAHNTNAQKISTNNGPIAFCLKLIILPYTFLNACQRASSGSGAVTFIVSLLTGCTNSIYLERRQIEPSLLLRGEPYFRSPLIGEPIFES